MAFDYFGFVIADGSEHLYSAGDTLVYEGLSRILRELDVTTAILPVNGRDREREALGIVGNMNAAEAARLAAESRAGFLIPCHTGMFAANTADPSDAVSAVEALAPDVGVWITRPGQALELPTR